MVFIVQGDKVIEVVVSQFSFTSTATYYGIYFFFAILILFITGLISLSVSNHLATPSIKNRFKETGWVFVLFSAFVVLCAVLFIPQLVENASQKSKVVNAQEITQKLVSESGYARIVVNETEYINSYLLNDEVFCDSSAQNKQSSVLGLNEKNVIVEQMTLIFTVDENSRTCSYTLISENN